MLGYSGQHNSGSRYRIVWPVVLSNGKDIEAHLVGQFGFFNQVS
jgi:hypothetical protein